MAALKLPVASPAPPPSSIDWALPMDLLLEIVACSDALTLVRCAAACKLLRRDILNPPFIRRVTRQGGVVPPGILTHLNLYDDENDDDPLPQALSLVHPATPAAMSFFDDHLSPYMPRFADDLLGEHYKVVRSRGGLVLLRRCRFSSNRHPNLCVYDPITGNRSFLSYPPGINPKTIGCFDSCTLLTAADGIDCSFLLFCPRLVSKRGKNKKSTRTIKIYVATSACGTWEPAAMSDNNNYFRSQHWLAMHRDAVILHGGVIHWLVCDRGVIVTYNVRTMAHGTINLPRHVTNFKGQGQVHLESHDGRKLLCLLCAKGFNISIWRQLPSGDWPQEAVMIDTEEKLRTLHPDISAGRPFQFASTGSNAVLLHINSYGPSTSCRALLCVLDLETMEIRALPDSTASFMLLEINLPSQLRAMKIYS